MRRAAATSLLWLALAFVATSAPAQDAPPPAAGATKAPRASEAADAAIAAQKDGDAKTLEAIAKRPTPDVWAIVDHLLDRGERDAALALAKAAPGPDTDKLPAYVEGWKPSPDDAPRRAATKQVAALETARKPDSETLAALDGVPEGPQDVLHVRIRQARATALSRTGKVKEALAEYDAACAVAERIGWTSREAAMRYNAGTVAMNAGEFKAAVPLLEHAAALHERRGDLPRWAASLVNLGASKSRLNDREAARPILEKALEIAERCGAADAELRALENLACVVEDLKRARESTERAIPLAERLNAREILGGLHFNLGIAVSHYEGDAAGAPEFERALAIRRTLGDRVSIAKTLRFLAGAHTALGDHDAALREYAEARTLYEAAGSEEGLAYVERGVGALHHVRGDLVKAIEHYRRAEAHALKSEDPFLLGRVRCSLAQTDVDRGDSAAARDRLATIAADFRRLKSPAEEADALSDQAAALMQLGDFQSARSRAEEALRIAQDANATPAVANALIALAGACSELGERARAGAALERAFGIAQTSGNRAFEAAVLLKLSAIHDLRHESAEAIRCAERALELSGSVSAKGTSTTALRRLGLLHYHVCDYEKAQSFHEKSLAIHEAAKSPLEVGQDLVNLANVLSDRGENARAQAWLERAVGLFEAGGDKRDLAAALGSLQIVLDLVGDSRDSMATKRRVVALSEEVGDESGLASALGNLANDLIDAGQVDEALALEDRALQLRRKNDDQAGLAYSSMGLGKVHAVRRELDLAMTEYERALSLWEGLHNPSGACSARDAVAWIWHERGDAERALAVWQKVLADAEGIGERSREQTALASIASCLRDLGRPREAIAAARRSIAVGRVVVAGFSDEHAAGARSTLLPAVAAGFRAAQTLDDPAEALYFIEAAKAGAFLEGVGSRNGLRDAVLSPELRDAERAASSHEAAAAWSLRRAREFGDAESYTLSETDLKAAHDERTAVVGRIQREAKLAAGVVEPRIAGLAEVQAALRADEAFVHFALLDPFAVALVVQPKAVRIVAIGDADAVRAAASAVRVDDGTHDPAKGIEDLRTLLVAPLGLDAGVKRLLVSADDVLTFTPFCALCGDREIAMLPSATTWALLRDTASARGEGVLALGDPDYGVKTPVAAPVAVVRSAERLLPLPGTREEAKSVGTKVLLGAEATEANLRAGLASQRWRAVHLACHGVIDTERPALSALALTPTAQDDGFLTALDVFRLRVPADLVVLSACRTGGGKVVRGEGVLGLTRAFMFAGAPRVLVSLWKVDDAATVVLMKRFYARWNEGLAPARALREAQAFVAAQPAWRHPKFWAAWTLWGLPD